MPKQSSHGLLTCKPAVLYKAVWRFGRLYTALQDEGLAVQGLGAGMKD
jgi:hypothetical protein